MIFVWYALIGIFGGILFIHREIFLVGGHLISGGERIVGVVNVYLQSRFSCHAFQFIHEIKGAGVADDENVFDILISFGLDGGKFHCITS